MKRTVPPTVARSGARVVARRLAVLTALFLLLLIILPTQLFSQTFARTLRLQSPRIHGADVELLQERLVDLGISSVGEIDGWYGPKTAGGVEAFRRIFGFGASGVGIQPAGVVDRDLWDYLFSEAIDPTLAAVLRFAESTDWSAYTREEADLFGYSTEGAHREVYTAGDGGIVRAVIRYFGETGRRDQHFYFYRDNAVAMLEIRARYSMPMYFDEFTNDETRVEYSLVLRENDRVHEARNGRLVRSEADLDGELAMIAAESR